MCLESRKLFGQQHQVDLISHADHEWWLEAWRDACSHHIFFLGSKGETAGNSLCQLHHGGNGKFHLKIRLPDELVAEGDSKYFLIAGADFAYDRPALNKGWPIAWQ